MRRIGLLPHADLPHILPFFRLARALRKLGHDVYVFGSDIVTLTGSGRMGHRVAWSGQIEIFQLQGVSAVHQNRDMHFCDWLRKEMQEKAIEILVLDAVWQGLAYEFINDRQISVLINHAGLPDFRSADIPSWWFVHPDHPRSLRQDARRANEGVEAAGGGIRNMMSAVKRLTQAGRVIPDEFDFGCGEFANLPAKRAVCFCPDVEFPEERGRTEYLGSQLAGVDDIDRQTLPAEIVELGTTDRPLIACVFGTSGMCTSVEQLWLASACKRLAEHFSESNVIAVMPDQTQNKLRQNALPPNLRLFKWIPLWELLDSWSGAKVLVSTPGVGAFREAVYSATPIVAVPRRVDQVGAAARVEYFGLGKAWSRNRLPRIDVLVENVTAVFTDSSIKTRCAELCDKARAFDAGNPLQRVIDAL